MVLECSLISGTMETPVADLGCLINYPLGYAGNLLSLDICSCLFR